MLKFTFHSFRFNGAKAWQRHGIRFNLHSTLLDLTPGEMLVAVELL